MWSLKDHWILMSALLGFTRCITNLTFVLHVINIGIAFDILIYSCTFKEDFYFAVHLSLYYTFLNYFNSSTRIPRVKCLIILINELNFDCPTWKLNNDVNWLWYQLYIQIKSKYLNCGEPPACVHCFIQIIFL